MRLLQFVSALTVCSASVLAFSGPVSQAHAAPNDSRLAKLVRSGQSQQAFDELKASNPQPADVAFFKGIVAQAGGNHGDAIAQFSRALVLNPAHMNARRELGRSLFHQKRYREAEHVFKTLVRIDQNRQMDDIYRDYLTRIRNRKPFGLSGHFSLLPSTNVNRGTENLIYDSLIGNFVIDPDSQVESGVGIQGGLSGHFRFPSGERLRNILTWGVVGTAYEKSKFNTLTGRLGFRQIRQLNRRTKLSYGPHARYSLRADDGDFAAYGGSIALQRTLTSKDLLTVKGLYEHREFTTQDHNTGAFMTLSADHHHQWNASFSHSMGMTLSRRTTGKDHSSFKGVQLRAGVKKAWNGGFVTGFGINGGIRHYDEDFPLAGERREDRFYGASVSVQHNRFSFKGFVPRATCSYLEADSNIAFYEHNVGECNLSVAKRF